jgi:hypothetical protein
MFDDHTTHFYTCRVLGKNGRNRNKRAPNEMINKGGRRQEAALGPEGCRDVAKCPVLWYTCEIGPDFGSSF